MLYAAAREADDSTFPAAVLPPLVAYVAPFRSGSSYLLRKVRGLGFGSTVPLGRASLSKAEIRSIELWIL